MAALNVGSLVNIQGDLGLIVGVLPANPSGGTDHWRQVQFLKSYYVWINDKIMGPMFGSELVQC